VIFADRLMQAGYASRRAAASRSRPTTCSCPAEKVGDHREAEGQVKEIQAQYTSGLVTEGERYNKVVDIWGRAATTSRRR
jgi:DNA-directed RNA polymerase subunit beta'